MPVTDDNGTNSYMFWNQTILPVALLPVTPMKITSVKQRTIRLRTSRSRKVFVFLFVFLVSALLFALIWVPFLTAVINVLK